MTADCKKIQVEQAVTTCDDFIYKITLSIVVGETSKTGLRNHGVLMRSFLRHAKIQAPLATARSSVSDFWRKAFARAGRYKPIGAVELSTVERDDVYFSGDSPICAGGAHKQTCLCFATPPPLIEKVENLVVTPAGAGWKDNVLYEKYSSSKPGLRALWPRPSPKSTVPEAFFVQSEHLDTFGDWMAEYLAPLARIGDIAAPVLLPSSLAARPYVIRDAARLGVYFRAVKKPVLIENAKVVRQPKVIRYWTSPDAVALKDFLTTSRAEPDSGSVVYLSRRGERSQIAERTHPHMVLEKVVRERGGLVILTAEASLDDYLHASHSAETVIFDHGSAAYNMVYWRPKRAIEIVSDAWWMSSFLFFANAIGVKDYKIIRSDLGGTKKVAAKLTEALAAPLRETEN